MLTSAHFLLQIRLIEPWRQWQAHFCYYSLCSNGGGEIGGTFAGYTENRGVLGHEKGINLKNK